MVAKNKAIPIVGNKESFFRIVEHDMKAGDSYRGYQCERVDVVDGQIVKRELVDKPNFFEFAQSAMLDLMDPRNNVVPLNPSDFV